MNLLQFLVLLPATLLASIVALKMYLKHVVRYCTSSRSLHGQTAIVTGATSAGIGLETAVGLAKRGARVIIGARDLARGEGAAEEIRTRSKNKDVVVKQLDLSLLSSVRKFCDEVRREESRVDILVNNAGVALTEKKVTVEGFELHYVTNHLGPFLLTNLLIGIMSPNARIVNVSSTAHTWPRSLNLQNRNSTLNYDSSMIYPISKLYNILFTVHLATLLQVQGKSITVNVVHPGVVSTELFRDAKKLALWRFLLGLAGSFFRTPWEGAQCSLYAAVDEEVEGVSGKYFDNCRIAPMSKLVDKQTAEELWRLSCKDAGLKHGESVFSVHA